MSKYARVVDGQVAEVFNLPPDTLISACFHADVASQFVECQSDVEAGWIARDGDFSPPVPVQPTEGNS